MDLRDWAVLQTNIFKLLNIDTNNIELVKMLSTGLRPYRGRDYNLSTIRQCEWIAYKILKIMGDK